MNKSFKLSFYFSIFYILFLLLPQNGFSENTDGMLPKRPSSFRDLEGLVQFQVNAENKVVAFAKVGNKHDDQRTKLIRIFTVGRLSKDLSADDFVKVKAVDPTGTIKEVRIPFRFLVKAALFPNPAATEIEAKLMTAPDFVKHEARLISLAAAQKQNPRAALKKAADESAERAWRGLTRPNEKSAQTQAALPLGSDAGNTRSYYPANFDIQRWRYAKNAEVPYTNDPQHSFFITDNFSDNQVDIYNRTIYGPIGSDWPQASMRKMARSDKLNYVPLGAEEINAVDRQASATGKPRDIALANYLCEKAEAFAKTQPDHHIGTIVSAGHSNYTGIGLFGSHDELRNDNSLKDNNPLLVRLMACFKEKGITVGEWRAFGCNAGTNADVAIDRQWSAPRSLAYGLNGKKGLPTKVWVADARVGFYGGETFVKLLSETNVLIAGDMIEISRKKDDTLSDTLVPVAHRKGELAQTVNHEDKK